MFSVEGHCPSWMWRVVPVKCRESPSLLDVELSLLGVESCSCRFVVRVGCRVVVLI